MTGAEASGSIRGHALLGGEWVPTRIAWRRGVITTMERVAGGCEELYVAPGFVDLHCHGGGGADVMEAGDAPHVVARAHARFGVAAFLATTMTAPVAEIEEALVAVARAMARQGPDEARILGVHLEGPFISPDRLGAQPPFALPARIDLLERFCALAPIRVVTMAPEADPSGEAADWLRARGVRVQIGHTNADYATARDWLERRAHGVTHLYNAMSGFEHRSAGAVGAALAHAAHAEIIPDLVHVDAGALRVALRAVPGLYAVTDATAAAGMPDGAYRLGRRTVLRGGDAVRLPSGELAGSCLTMDRAVANLHGLGLPLAAALACASAKPARRLGEPLWGRVFPGGPATFVAFDASFARRRTVLNGRVLDAP